MSEGKHLGDATQREACLQLGERLPLSFRGRLFMRAQLREPDSA